MALFTTSQANACTITKIKKTVDGTECFWNIGFKDNNNNHYEFVTDLLSSDCSKSDIKTFTLNQIQIMEKIETPSIIITNENSLGVNETVG